MAGCWENLCDGAGLMDVRVEVVEMFLPGMGSWCASGTPCSQDIPPEFVSTRGDNYMCQNDWLLNQRKWYKFSTSSRTWNESQRDCMKLQAHLPVIHTLREPEFIQKSLQPGQLSRIGLYIVPPRKQWMWINEHTFVEQKNFLIIGPTDSMSWAVTTGNGVRSEECDSTIKSFARCCLNNNRKSRQLNKKVEEMSMYGC